MLLGFLQLLSSSSSNFCVSLFVFITLLISFISQTIAEAAGTYMHHDCLNAITTLDTTYRSNLNHLLSYLSSNATRTTGFYNATASSGTSKDTVYGMFLCHSDLPAEACREYVFESTKDLVQCCPQEEGVVGYYEECMLCYFSQYIFSSSTVDPFAFISGIKSISEPIRLSKLLRATFNELASEISDLGPRAKKVGMKEARFTASRTVYTLVQCTPDLAVSIATSVIV